MVLETGKRKLHRIWQVSRMSHYPWVICHLRGHHDTTKLHRHPSWDRIQRLNSKINLDVISSLSSKTSPGKIRSHSSDWESQCILWLFLEWIPYVDTVWVKLHLVIVLENSAEIQTEPEYCGLIYQGLPMCGPEWSREVRQLRSTSQWRSPGPRGREGHVLPDREAFSQGFGNSPKGQGTTAAREEDGIGNQT